VADKFGGFSDGIGSPAREMFLITPHATNAVDPLPKAIRANTAGTLALRAVGSTADVSINVVAGEVIDVRAEFVRAAGTSAVVHGLA
jgi:hypothetical protein